jgi:hypothetical protein
MRIFALLLLSCLTIVAFRSKRPDLPQCSAATDSPANHTENILFQTADGGKTWKDVSLGLPNKFVANSAFTQNGELYLADRSGVIYHKSKLDSGVWEREEIGGIFSDAGGLFPEEIVINGLYAGRAQPYASVYDKGIFRRNSGTGLWEPLNTALPEKRVYAFVENSDGAIFVSGESGVYKSMDDGKSWKQVYFEGYVTHLQAFNGILLASSNKGVLRSANGGEQWEQVMPEGDGFYKFDLTKENFVAVRFAGIVTDAYPAISLRSSADAGLTWPPMYTGPIEFKGLYDFKKAGKYLFCCHKGGISRSGDGGNTWELVREPIDSKEPLRYELLISGDTVFAVVVFAGC